MKWPFRLIKKDAPVPRGSTINDKTVGDLKRVCDQTGILNEDARLARIAEIITSEDDQATGDLEMLAKLIGQTDESESECVAPRY